MSTAEQDSTFCKVVSRVRGNNFKPLKSGKVEVTSGSVFFDKRAADFDRNVDMIFTEGIGTGQFTVEHFTVATLKHPEVSPVEASDILQYCSGFAVVGNDLTAAVKDPGAVSSLVNPVYRGNGCNLFDVC